MRAVLSRRKTFLSRPMLFFVVCVSAVVAADGVGNSSTSVAPTATLVPLHTAAPFHSTAPSFRPSISMPPSLPPTRWSSLPPSALAPSSHPPIPPPPPPLVPTLAPSTHVPSEPPAAGSLPPTFPPTSRATQPLPPPPKHHASVLKILGKAIAWLILLGLAVLAFGAVMTHRYRILHFLRGVWYTLLQLQCTIMLRTHVRALLNRIPYLNRGGADDGAGSSGESSSALNTIIFDNDLTEGLLMRENLQS